MKSCLTLFALDVCWIYMSKKKDRQLSKIESIFLLCHRTASECCQIIKRLLHMTDRRDT
jgi:hypothetical protein